MRGNNVNFLTSEITPKKVRGQIVDFLTIEITSKKTTWIFQPSKLRQENHVETTWIRGGFSHHRNYVEKGTWKQRG